ncbi:heavy metal-associated domain-containing protein [Mycobacterium sp. NPDC006124]|uniref:heavy-metal-associated domain-containing protein n=1 Tax=Mycobacterium sp. NPDC006124 TaxID=3156729 RepID=UPI0033B1B93B
MTNLELRTSLPLLELEDSSCGCCPPSTTSGPTTPATETGDSTAAAFPVTGMTCGHCVAAVTEEISAIPGVTDVTVDLKPGATSTLRVTSQHGVTQEQIAAALDEAGDYHLATD